MILHVADLAVSYGRIQALDGITFEMDGGAVGLLGPNGAGKSTLLKALLGFVRFQQGVVRVFDYPMPARRLEVRQRLGYMPERDIVSPKVTAVGFLRYCGRLCGMTDVDALERAHEVLNYVGLGESRYRKMETYSTGMCQRVKFAQALIHDPKLLLLDEPTNGLDPEGRIEMLDLIREVSHKRNVCVLLSSHLLPDVEYVCDRVIMINKGRVAREGNIRELTTLRERQFEIRLRENQPAFFAALEQAGCTWNGNPGEKNVLTLSPDLDAKAVFEIARAHGAQVRHWRPVQHTLEEVFMAAIGREVR